jgi:GDPmannose 4,6-dehydratase
MPKAIISGVTGQDGSHMSDLLLSKGYEVIGITRRTSNKNTDRISHLLNNRNFRVVEGDISDSHSITSLLMSNKNVDEFYNFAAQSHVATSFNQPNLTFDMTGKSVINILQAIVDNNLNHIRFYQASSSEMFGSNYNTKVEYSNAKDFNLFNGVNCRNLNLISNIVKYQDEQTNFMPQSPYAVAKLAAHHMVRIYRQAHNLHASCGILFNHEGPRRGEEFVTRKITKWIGSYLRWLKSNNLKPNDISNICKDGESIYASGVQYSFPKLRLGNLNAARDWGYAPDYMEAAWLMLQQDKPDDYVICTERTRTIKDFLDTAFYYANIPFWNNLVYIDPKFYRPCEVEYLRGSYKKAQEKLDWSPKCSFEDMVKEMVLNDSKL